MSDDERDALASLGEQLREGGFETTLRLRQGLVPDQLHIALSPDDLGRVVHLELMFLPDTKVLPILQCFIGLPYVVEPSAVLSLCRFLCEANRTAVLGGFGYMAEQQLVYYRYNTTTSPPGLDERAVGWSMALATYLLEQLGPLIEHVAGGGDYEQAVETLAEIVRADVAAAAADD